MDRWARSAWCAARYEDLVACAEEQGDFPFAGYSRVLQRVQERAEAQAGMRILDLGVGTGALARRFLDQGCRVVGVDYSPEMLALARDRCSGLETIEADIRESGWLSDLGCFERIVSAYVFHEMPPAEGAAHLWRLADRGLAPAGRIVVGDVLFADAAARERAWRRWIRLWDPEEFYWAADEALAVLRDHGLEGAFEQVSECGGVLVIR